VESTYAEVLTEYNRSAFGLFFVVEDHYKAKDRLAAAGPKNSDSGTPPLVNRRQDYWTMTCGATGSSTEPFYLDLFQGVDRPFEHAMLLGTGLHEGLVAPPALVRDLMLTMRTRW